MRPKKHETTGSGDLFRARLDQIINMLAGKIDREFIDGEIAPLCCDGGRSGQWRKSRNRRGMPFRTVMCIVGRAQISSPLSKASTPGWCGAGPGRCVGPDHAWDKRNIDAKRLHARAKLGAAARRCILQLSVVACPHSEEETHSGDKSCDRDGSEANRKATLLYRDGLWHEDRLRHRAKARSR
jgi:IS5 family transposase